MRNLQWLAEVGGSSLRFWERLRRSRLQRRILAWSFVPTALILFAVALVAVRAYGSVTEQQAVQRNRELARFSATSLGSEINQFSLDLDSVARQAQIISPDRETRQAALETAANRLAVFDAGAVILDGHGQFVAAWPERSGDMGEDWSSREYFVRLLGSSRPVFSNIVPDGPEDADVISVAVPITSPEGELSGVLVGMFRLGATSVSALYGDIVKLRAGVNGDVYVVDGTGRVIHHPDPSLIGLDLSAQNEVKDVVDGNSGALRTRDLNDRDVVAGYAPVPGTDWGLVAVESWATLIEPTQGYRTFLIVLLVLGLVIPSLVVLLGVRRITRPVTALTMAAREVAAGDFDHAVTVYTRDELQELAEQFNEMAAQLRSSYEELDRRVAARTRELATVNAVASVVSGSLDLERVLDNALATIMEELDFGAGVAFILSPTDDAIRPVAKRNVPSSLLSVLSTLAAGKLRDRSASADDVPIVLLIPELPHRETWQEALDEGWRTVVQIPVGAKSAVFGDLILLSKEEGRPAAEQLAPLSSLGSQIGMAVENARLYEKAEESAAAAERNRLARDLHDAVSQTLFSASLIADVLPRIYERDAEQGRKRLEELRQLTRGALAEMRTLLLELRPAALVEAKLSELVRQLSESVIGRSRIPIKVEVESCEGIPPEVQVAFYRIAQEALNNVSKHSGASSASVALSCRATEGALSIELVVQDDGAGLDLGLVRPGSLGLGIMSERAEAIGASLRVVSSPGKGVRITASWTGHEAPPPSP